MRDTSPLGAAPAASARPADPPERLCEDDQAARTEAQFQAGALQRVRLAAAADRRTRPGVCENCGEACVGLAVYCDPDCRADHQHRLKLQQRLGRAGGARGA